MFTETSKNNNTEKPGIVSRALKLLAYPAAAFAGWWVTRNQIRHYTFEKLQNRGGYKSRQKLFEGLSDGLSEGQREKLKKELKIDELGNQALLAGEPAAHEKRLKEFTRKTVLNLEEEGAQFLEKNQPLEKQYTRAIRDRMEALGLDKLSRQSKYIYKPQFHKALLEGITAFSIVLIGALSLAENKSIAHMLDRKNDEKAQDR